MSSFGLRAVIGTALLLVAENQATPVPLGGQYEGESCSDGQDGAAHCTVWERDGRVVAVQAFCLN